MTKVYDGDTVTVDTDLGFGIVSKGMVLRLYGINAPEVRGPEREQGLLSRDFLREQVLDKDITIMTMKDSKGKYGRYLAYLVVDDTNINELLVEEGLAERREY